MASLPAYRASVGDCLSRCEDHIRQCQSLVAYAKRIPSSRTPNTIPSAVYELMAVHVDFLGWKEARDRAPFMMRYMREFHVKLATVIAKWTIEEAERLHASGAGLSDVYPLICPFTTDDLKATTYLIKQLQQCLDAFPITIVSGV